MNLLVLLEVAGDTKFAGDLTLLLLRRCTVPVPAGV
jgi:hypothetical protein